ncbi:MAG: VWA domain-containing protein [Actinobacteria bacterium]|nr:VWA domain-containing protein [Actinomycetota bacterium]
MKEFISTNVVNDKEEKIRQRTERFAQVFTRVNSVLALRPIKVTVKSSEWGAPAWSTSDEITFNSSKIGELNDARTIASIKGLSFHELSHILYTPRRGSDLVHLVTQRGLFASFNALEDMRIEMLTIGKFPSIINWFNAMIAKYILETPEAMEKVYPLLRGRRYLPVELRREARARFHRQDQIDEICDIVDQYTEIIFETQADTDLALSLIQRFANLNADTDEEFPCPVGHGDRPCEGVSSDAHSRPLSPKKQKQDKENSKKNESEDDAPIDNDDDDSDDDDFDEENFDEEDSDDDDSGRNPGEPSKPKEDTAGEGEPGESDDDSDAEPASIPKAGTNDSDLVMESILNDILDDVINNVDVAKDIDDLLRQINGLPSLSSNNAPTPESARHTMVDANSDTVEASRAFARELERIRNNADPAWDKRLSAGKLNPLRAMRGDDPLTVFDQWNMGRQDATDIECVILLDVSGSMAGSKIQQAYQAMYAIKRALDKIDASSSVVLFNSNAELLYSAREKAEGRVRHAGCGGGTDPTKAIAYATKLLAESQRAVKLFFAITDGDWVNDEIADEAVARMKRAGVLTSLAFIPDGSTTSVNSHRCEIVNVVNKVSDITGLARSIVRTGIARRLTNA